MKGILLSMKSNNAAEAAIIFAYGKYDNGIKNWFQSTERTYCIFSHFPWKCHLTDPIDLTGIESDICTSIIIIAAEVEAEAEVILVGIEVEVTVIVETVAVAILAIEESEIRCMSFAFALL